MASHAFGDSFVISHRIFEMTMAILKLLTPSFRMFICLHMCLKSRPVAVTPKSQKCPFLRRKTHVVSSSCPVVPGPGCFSDLIGSSARHGCVLSVDMGSWWCCVCPLFTILLAPTLKFCSIGPKKFRKNGPSATLSKSVGTIIQQNFERIEEPGWA